MARSPRRRRRQNVVVAATVIASICLVTLVHDVHTFAARAVATRASLNLTFGSLARSVMVDEAAFGANAATLLSHGPHLSRAEFAGQLTLLSVEGSQLLQRVEILQQPKLDHNVQSTLLQVTDLRVSSLQELLRGIEDTLAFPHAPGRSAGASAVQHSLQRSDQLWARARRLFRTSPGHVRLVRSRFALSEVPLANEVTAIESAPLLQPAHGVTISAVAVNPAPFPAPRFELVLPPVTSASINVVVTNTQYVNQTLSVRLMIAPRSSRYRATVRSVTISLGPLRSRAVNFSALTLAPSERAVVTVQLSGATIASGGSGSRQYLLSVASAPTV